MATRKPNTNSASAAIAAALAASTPLPKIPVHVRMRPKDAPFVEGILRARTRAEWTDADLVVAGQLARCQADIETETETLDSEGTVVRNDRGTQIMNPRVSILEQLARREMALMRTLRIGGTTVPGKRAELDRARGLEQQAGRAKDELAEDPLLA
jgi:hypothetical protein